ncbi:MAG TPA: GNAT family N-acetyltransferase [Desulfosporosinus sp.]|nr:GNAT family N-acetyltransferase [Desulfosporosinus sp.]
MEIRLVLEHDLIKNEDILKKLIKENLKMNFKSINSLAEPAVNGYNNMIRFIRDGSAIIIGAFENSDLIGFLWAYSRDFLGEQRLFITQIIVGSNARSSGIGKQLLYTLEGIAQEMNIKKIELMATVENEGAIKFYKKNGFTEERIQFEKELRSEH